MSTKGRTATDFSAVVDAAAAESVATGGAAARCPGSHNLYATNPATATTTKIPTARAARCRDRPIRGEDVGAGPPLVAGASIAVLWSADFSLARRTAFASLGIERSMSLPLASSHCEVFRKYSRSAGK